MNSSRKYVFGYLFVKFAKLLAILTAIATTVYIVIITGGYRVASHAAAYQKDAELQLTMDRLVEEVDFATREIGRIAPVSDLKPMEKVLAPTQIVEFDGVSSALSSAEARRVELKTRLVSSVERGIEALQTKIGDTVREIEKVRQTMDVTPPSNNADVPDQKPSSSQPAGRSVLDKPARSIFGTGVSNTLQSAHDVLSESEAYFKKLAESAEKEENKKLIKSVLDDIIKLKSWLPALPKPPEPERVVQPRPLTFETEPPQPPELDPLETAIATHRALAEALSDIHNTVTNHWTLDNSIMDAANTIERERDQCRAAEGSQDLLRTGWLTQTFLTILAGLAISFMILVLADFIQSFFDTASSAREILGHLKGRGE